jgi:hypothetical protein
MSMSEQVLHPVQNHDAPNRMTSNITLRAYEVYCHMYGEQKALVTGFCRGGFSIGELIAFLYAHSFPKEEWRSRVDEAFAGIKRARDKP